METPVRIENRAQLVYLLTEAAELEHGILCCYLFTAFSMKRDPAEGVTTEQLRAMRQWRRTFFQIAVEEMVHLSLVCNLLTAVGGAPHLRRPNLPTSPRAYPPAFKLGLRPFDVETLDGYVFLERPEGMQAADGDPAASDAVPGRLSDIFSSERDYATIGHLYRGIEDGFEYLAQKYGEGQLFVGPDAGQTAGAFFDLPGLIPVTDLASAVAAAQAIVTQGEGARGDSEEADYGKFCRIRDEYEQLRREDPEFQPGRAVMVNPYTRLPTDLSASPDVSLVEDPLSIDVCNLFDGCYEMLIQVLGRLFAHGGESEAELTQLADITVGLMSDVVGPLGSTITPMLAGASHPGLMAGPSFRLSREVNTPPHKSAARLLFRERLTELAAYCGFLQTYPDAPQALTRAKDALTKFAAGLADS